MRVFHLWCRCFGHTIEELGQIISSIREINYEKPLQLAGPYQWIFQVPVKGGR